MALNFLNNGYFAGKVGIGETSPSAKLQITTPFASSPSGCIFLFNNGSNTPGGGSEIIFGSSTSATPVNYNAKIAGVRSSLDNGSSDLLFQTTHVTTATIVPTTKMIIKSDGKVGIGTTGPTALLEVRKDNDTIYDATSDSGQDNNTATVLVSNDNVTTNTFSQIAFHNKGTNRGISRIVSIGVGSASTDLAFVTENNNTKAEKMRILSGGNVGIGTTSPSAKLHINTGATYEVGSLSGSMLIEPTGVAFNGYGAGIVLGAGRGGRASGGAAIASVLDSASDVDRSGLSFFYHNSTFSDPRTEGVRLNADGKVGIGTTTPDARLDVNGGLNSTHAIFSGQDGRGLKLSTENTLNNDDGVVYDAQTSTGKHLFKVSGAEKMRIDSAGNVGIGTTSPSEKLEVEGNIKLSSVGTGNSASSYEMLFYGTTSSGTQTDQAKIHSSPWISNSNGGNLQLYTSNASNVLTERMRIDGAGNVGIGTDSPTSLLEISKQLSAASTIDYPYTISSRDDGNLINQVGGEGVGIKFRIAGNAGTTPGDSLVGASIAAIRESSSDTDSSTGLGLFVTQNDETLDEALRIDHDRNIQFNAYGAGTLVSDASGNITVSSGGGAGGPYLPLAGGTMTGNTDHNDNVYSRYGTADQLRIWNNGSNSYIFNYNSGNINIGNDAVDKDVIFYADRGDGLEDVFFRLDGSETNGTTVLGVTLFPDKSQARFGNQGDLRIYHDGSNSYITDTGTGSLFIQGSDIFIKTNSTENAIFAQGNGKVELFHNNITKFETTSTGVSVTGIASAATFSGDLNGTINTATTAVTQVDAVDNNTVATTAYVNNKIQLIPAGLVFQGTWNAATNTPTLTSGSGTTGNFYIVSVAGSTNLDGITDWKVGDWAVFIEQGASDQWEKIDNSSVLDGIGTGQTLPLWSGSGTSNTLADSYITQNTALANDIIIPQYIRHTSDTNTLFGFSQPDNFIINTNNANALTINSSQNATFAGDVTINKATPILTFNSSNVNVDQGIVFSNAGTFDASIKHGPSSADIVFDIGRNSTWGGAANFKLDTYQTYYMTRNSHAFKILGVDALSINSSSNATFAGTIDSGTITSTGIVKAASAFQATAGDMTFFVNNVGEAMRIQQNTGNVGIGTTSPATKLHAVLESSSTNTVLEVARFERQTTGTAAAGIGSAISFASEFQPGSSAVSGQIASLWENVSTAAASMTFSTWKSGVGISEAMRITNSGNVGIGVTGPSATLHVKNTIGNYPFIVETPYDRVAKLISTDSGADLIIQDSNSTDNGNSISVSGDTMGLNTAGSNRIKILANGNVGIGATGPQSKLQVAGGIQMADDTDTASATKVGTMRYRTGTEYVEVTGTELITNGDFATDTNWTKNAEWTISGGKANAANSVSYHRIVQNGVQLSNTTLYRLIFTVSNLTSGGVICVVGGNNGLGVTANGTYIQYVTSASTAGDALQIASNPTFTGSIDNVSLMEVTEEQASYADMCMQTGASTYEWVNIVRNTY